MNTENSETNELRKFALNVSQRLRKDVEKYK